MITIVQSPRVYCAELALRKHPYFDHAKDNALRYWYGVVKIDLAILAYQMKIREPILRARLRDLGILRRPERVKRLSTIECAAHNH